MRQEQVTLWHYFVQIFNLGETFCDSDVKFQMTEMFVPDPVMSLAVKPIKESDLDAFLKVLNRFQRDDPTFTVHHNIESK